MDIRKAYRYRLYPTRAQADRLEWVLRRCQELYNAALQERRDAYHMAGATVGYYTQKRAARCQRGAPGVPPDRLPGLAGRDPAGRPGLCRFLPPCAGWGEARLSALQGPRPLRPLHLQ